MLKRFIIISALTVSPALAGELLYGGGYISPERYTVNEADMIYDYSNIPPAPKLNVDNLDDMRFKAPNLIEKDINISITDDTKNENIEQPSKKAQKEAKKAEKKHQKELEKAAKNNPDEAYKRRLPYKFAKWWVDQRYKREEEHHGTLHEIKVQKRLDYEQKLEEEAKLKESI